MRPAWSTVLLVACAGSGAQVVGKLPSGEPIYRVSCSSADCDERAVRQCGGEYERTDAVADDSGVTLTFYCRGGGSPSGGGQALGVVRGALQGAQDGLRADEERRAAGRSCWRDADCGFEGVCVQRGGSSSAQGVCAQRAR